MRTYVDKYFDFTTTLDNNNFTLNSRKENDHQINWKVSLNNNDINVNYNKQQGYYTIASCYAIEEKINWLIQCDDCNVIHDTDKLYNNATYVVSTTVPEYVCIFFGASTGIMKDSLTAETNDKIGDIIKLIKELKYRPSWDEYFITTCYLISKRSSCERLHVGCILVKDKRIIATGYNGHIPGAPHESIVRDNHEQMTIHAETNAVTDAAKRGANLNECVAYVTHMPCINCAKILIASGIKKIVFSELYKNDNLVSVLCKKGFVSLIQFDHVNNKMINIA